MSEPIVFTMFLIFAGAAVMSTFVLWTRQSLLVAYILVGCLIGPFGFGWVTDTALVKQIGDVGIIFLLFLLGLDLHPQNLLMMLRKVVGIGILSSLIFGSAAGGIAYIFGFTLTECLIIGAAVMFSSTIIGIKLLPTTMLHHQHIGEVMISVLLLQDLLAIVVLLVIQGAAKSGFLIKDISMVFVSLPLLVGASFLIERYILVKLLARFDRTQEYIFLLAIGWCLLLAELAPWMGLSEEIGAFIAGVALAQSPIALYIAESLKPLRDFFLVLFFFAIGATFNFNYLPEIMLPAILIAATLLLIKPLIFKVFLQYVGETKPVATEVGLRLGQASEFSLLVGALALRHALISVKANSLLQAATILTFIVSSYVVVLKYPTPIALTDNMRRD
jgi:Kef-type K+ transport system membrane component KefB